MPTAFPFHHRIEVRFRDCDAMGHVNHAVYLTYLEQARFAFWREMTGAAAGPEAGIIIARAEIDYRSPAFAGEVVEVALGVDSIGRSSFTLLNAITAADKRLLAEARTVLVTYDYTANHSIPVSESARAFLERARLPGAAPSNPVK